MKNPIQPIIKDPDGTLRFKKNEIVDFLLENGGYDLNKIARMNFSNDDREQFSQLIGYSLSGFGELSYVSNETYNAAERMVKGKDERDARIEDLENTLENVKRGLKSFVSDIFKIHPDDLE